MRHRRKDLPDANAVGRQAQDTGKQRVGFGLICDWELEYWIRKLGSKDRKKVEPANSRAGADDADWADLKRIKITLVPAGRHIGS